MAVQIGHMVYHQWNRMAGWHSLSGYLQYKSGNGRYLFIFDLLKFFFFFFINFSGMTSGTTSRKLASSKEGSFINFYFWAGIQPAWWHPVHSKTVVDTLHDNLSVWPNLSDTPQQHTMIHHKTVLHPKTTCSRKKNGVPNCKSRLSLKTGWGNL